MKLEINKKDSYALPKKELARVLDGASEEDLKVLLLLCAISEDGTVDQWQCAVYYNGANGTKNPFMPKDAYADFEDRIKIIAGEAKVSPEKAKKILEATYFYPPAHHSYVASICGRACDTACYMHLEEQGKLSKKFKRPFRTREEWKFDIKDFEL